MIRRIFIFVFITGLILTVLFSQYGDTPPVFGLPNFTSVTRTPTPAPTSPPPPTATKKPSDPDPNPTSPPPQNTTVPTNTPTATLIPVTLAATPEGGYLPTAEACGLPPTVQTLNTVNVRSGPGTDYDTLGTLVYLEVRPIVGRAGHAEWWVIQLTNETIGWVANDVVVVQGNTSGVPIVGAEALDGETPTPGPLWDPTPNPGCPIIPTATPPPTDTPAPNTPTPTTAAESAAVEETATPTAEPTSTPTDEPTDEPEPTVEAEPSATATSVIPEGEATVAADSIASVGENAQPTAEPLTEPDNSAVAALPCASAVIGIAAIGLLAIFRRLF